jgi:hypothetical protein
MQCQHPIMSGLKDFLDYYQITTPLTRGEHGVVVYRRTVIVLKNRLQRLTDRIGDTNVLLSTVQERCRSESIPQTQGIA